jgi:enoyl-CoA hydratase/carnithine racemase
LIFLKTNFLKKGGIIQMTYETIQYELHSEGIGILSLNRPKKYNAVNQAMSSELNHFLSERENDLGTRIIIIKGNGEKGFCGGYDVTQNADLQNNWNSLKFYHEQTCWAKMILKMRQIPQILVSIVHGAAIGVGFSFVLASDIRIICPDARFSAAYINVGLGGADVGCSYLLPRMIGAGRAYELMLTGNWLSAQEAFDLGLVSRIVDKEKLMETALEFSRIMMEKNIGALRLTKEAINTNLDAGGLEQALVVENRNQALMFGAHFRDN